MSTKNRRRRAEFAAAAQTKIEVPLDHEIATRETLDEFYTTLYGTLENPDPVLRKTGASIAVFHDLRRDAHVSSCVRRRKAGTLRRDWELLGPTRPAELLTALFQDMDMLRVMREILDATLYGYQVLEIMWGKVGNMILPLDIIGKPQEWFWFDHSNALRRKAMTAVDGVEAEPKKFLLVQHEATYINPYGEGILGMCFWPTTFKRGGIKYWAKFLQKFGMPQAVGKLPRGANHESRQKLLSALTRMVQDACAVFPDDSSVELLEAAGKSASSDLYERHSRYHDGEISKVLLGHAAAADATPGRLGSDDNALAASDDLIDADSMLVESAFNQLIRWIRDFNPTTIGSELPTMHVFEDEGIDKSLAERDKIITEHGNVKFTRKHYERNYNLQPDEIIVNEEDTPPSTPVKPEAEFASPEKAQAMIDSLQPGQEVLQEMAEMLLKPLFDLRDTSTSFAQFKEGISKLYPTLDDAGMQQLLETTGLMATTWGRASVKEDGNA